MFLPKTIFFSLKKNLQQWPFIKNQVFFMNKPILLAVHFCSKKKTQLPNDIYILDFLGCIMRLINLADFDRWKKKKKKINKPRNVCIIRFITLPCTLFSENDVAYWHILSYKSDTSAQCLFSENKMRRNDLKQDEAFLFGLIDEHFSVLVQNCVQSIDFLLFLTEFIF